MQITIPCELYARMAEIPNLIDQTDKRKYLKSVFIERLNNKLFIVVTSIKIAAIEFLGQNDGPDEFIAVVIDPMLIAQCKKETAFNSNLFISHDRNTKQTTIQTTFGFVHPGNANVEIPKLNNFTAWRDWFPDDMPDKSKGAMLWNLSCVYALATASISGDLVFPEFIDANAPVVIRDFQSENWVGLFMPGLQSGETIIPATIPGWIE